MLDLPGHPLLDKDRLIGGCVRLRVTADVERLRTELEQLPPELWGTRGGRVGVHRVAEAIFLRGYAPAEGDKPVEDRPALAQLPAARAFLYEALGAPPLRALLARLPPEAVIAPHRDMPPYFGKTLRIHVPIVTHAQAWMFCAGRSYRMRAGEVWALNNSNVHGVWNASATGARTHLIADFVPTPPLLALLADGERELGERNAAVEQRLFGTPESAGPY